MKLGNGSDFALDPTDWKILQTLQEDCKISLARVGEQVGLSAPSVIDRIKKLEAAGVIRGYRAELDSRTLGFDVTAFIGVEHGRLEGIGEFEDLLGALDDVLECHHVTGGHTFLLKVKTQNTGALEKLISRIRTIPGVARTETMVVLSTHIERRDVPLGEAAKGAEVALSRKRSRNTTSKAATQAS